MSGIALARLLIVSTGFGSHVPPRERCEVICFRALGLRRLGILGFRA